VIRPATDPGQFALAAIGAEAAFACGWRAAEWAGLGLWRFASSVGGGRLIAASTTWPYQIACRWRLMPPVPPLPA
jgi:hypothetical protein